MTINKMDDLFTAETMSRFFPPERADQFFDALLGDAEEGAFDISLHFKNFLSEQNKLLFELHLDERPDKCLACNVTYGLPQVFSRHPVINIERLVAEIVAMIGKEAGCSEWHLGATQTVSQTLHVIPLSVTFT